MPIAKVNGINVNYEVEGQGEPLVMIAGFGMDQTGWKAQLPAFKKQYRVLTFDNRGVGKSDKPKGSYSAKMMAEDTKQLMDHLNIKKAHILGVSMGGLIAQEMAINYPERIIKLILGCTYACQDNGANGFTSKLPFRQSIVNLIGICMGKPFIRFFLPPVIKVQYLRMKEPGAVNLEGQRGCAIGYNSLDKLSSIKAPTLVIVGTKDRVVKSTSSEIIAQNIPNARLVKVDGGSHSFRVEMSNVFNKEVLNFLKNS